MRRPWLVVIGLQLLSNTAAVTQSVPPRVAGIGIGSTAFAVRAALGKPDHEEVTLGMRFWDYTQRQLTIIWRDDVAGVHGIIVRGIEAGVLRGVAVGDEEHVLRSSWGLPARVRQGGRYLDFVGDEWVMSAEVLSGHVVEMTLIRASGAGR